MKTWEAPKLAGAGRLSLEGPPATMANSCSRGEAEDLLREFEIHVGRAIAYAKMERRAPVAPFDKRHGLAGILVTDDWRQVLRMMTAAQHIEDRVPVQEFMGLPFEEVRELPDDRAWSIIDPVGGVNRRLLGIWRDARAQRLARMVRQYTPAPAVRPVMVGVDFASPPGGSLVFERYVAGPPAYAPPRLAIELMRQLAAEVEALNGF